jgi:hypothetical protein
MKAKTNRLNVEKHNHEEQNAVSVQLPYVAACPQKLAIRGIPDFIL